MLAALLLAATQLPPALLGEADAANERFVGCLYRMSREAHARHVAAAKFERVLAGQCLEEERVLMDVSQRIAKLRSEPVARYQRLAIQARQSVVETYRSFP